MRTFAATIGVFTLSLAWSGWLTSSARAADLDEALKAVQSISQQGAGQAAAIQGLQRLNQAQGTELMSILSAMNQANPLAANWLRGAFEAAADRHLQQRLLSAKELEAFVNDRTNDPRVRRLAYEWLVKVDAAATGRMVPKMLDDPSPEMRRDAVARIIAQAQQATVESEGTNLWQQALTGAVDEDQFDTIASALEKVGQPVTRADHFGLLLDWYVVGPFDNREMKGFDVAFPPEAGIDLSAKYEGMKGEVAWQRIKSDDKGGKFDIAKLTAPHKGAIDYLYSEFAHSADQPVEFRLATPNAWKLWVNGQLLFAREEYHRGTRFDQYIVRGNLQAGKNTLLVKMCQNEMDQDWAQDWTLQFRVCDLTGRAVHPAHRESAAK